LHSIIIERKKIEYNLVLGEYKVATLRISERSQLDTDESYPIFVIIADQAI